MSLRDVQHQGPAHRVIQRALDGDRLPHAFVLDGPDGVGKELFARGLAQLLLCPVPRSVELSPQETQNVGVDRLRIGCGTCADCVAVAANTHPDLHIVHRYLYRDHSSSTVRNRKGLTLSVDVVRQFIIDRVILTPARGRAKVFIMREADLITTAAQNALLKTLEEPPPATYLILLTASVDRLLETTRSRVQLVRFGPLPRGFVAARLAELAADVDDAQRDWCVSFAQGSLGRALECIEEKLYEANQQMLEGLSRLPVDPTGVAAKAWIDRSKSLGDAYRKRDPDITDTEAARRALKSLLHLSAIWYADVLRVQTGSEAEVVNSCWKPQLRQSADAIGARAIEAVNRIAEAEHQLDQNANTQLCIESLVHALGRLK